MSGDEHEDSALTQQVGGEAKAQAQESEAWWDAVHGEGELPSDGPSKEALAPLSEAEEDAMMASLFGTASVESPSRAEVPAPIPLRRSAGRGRTWAGAAMVALAASVAAIVLWPGGRDAPAYQLTMGGGDQGWRSGDEPAAAVPTFTVGSRIEVVLRPLAPTAEAGASPRAVLIDEHGREIDWPLRWESGAAATHRARGELGRELHLAPGAWRLKVELGPQTLEQRFRVEDGAEME